jgi:formamidopyrimidine-DNA glycosylase
VPELPEVETVRTGIAPVLTGARIEHAEIFDPRLTRPFAPEAVAAELDGERVAAVERRGKYLIVRFESGRVLLIHLRMTGSLGYAPSGLLANDPYRRAVLRLDNGSDVAYRDVRRFGTWELLEPGELRPYLAQRLGPEPLGALSAERLGERLSGRRAPLKAALLDQRTLAGIGNIYADEALWDARLHPLRPAGSLEPDEVARLHRAVRRALRRGIARQGATLTDYRTANGDRGAMQDEFRVYGRDGEPCERCGTPIAKTRVGGRGTWYCAHCQAPAPERLDADPDLSRF